MSQTQSQQINELIAENRQLYDYFQSRKDLWESDISVKKALLDSYIAGAKSQTPYYRQSKNQSLNGATGSPPFGFSSGSGATYTLMQPVISKIWTDRTALEVELLQLMGREGVRYIRNPFNIWRCEWSTVSPAHLFYFSSQVNRSVEVTQAMFIKRISGDVSGYSASGINNDSTAWQLTGRHLSNQSLAYEAFHPLRASASGAFYFCLAAEVSGNVDITDPTNWGFFPYIGDTQND